MNDTQRVQYYISLAARFDEAAQHYDRHFGPPTGSQPGNKLLTWLREEHLSILRAVLPEGGAVLDIGCGTGIEALQLVQDGYSVLGLDISPAMVRQAQTKAAAYGIRFGAVFKTLAAGKLSALDERGPFQGAFASLGTLNTEPNLAGFAAGLHDRLEPGAPFVATVMSRHCWFEIWYNLRRLQPGQTLKRGGAWAETRAGTGGVTAPVMFYAPGDFARHFEAHFTVERVLAFPLLLPPVHMAELYSEHEAHYAAMLDRERSMRERRGWCAWGDHFLMVLRHKSAAG